MRWMGVLFSVFLIIAFGLVFNAVQANSIANAMSNAFGWNDLYVGIAVVALSAVVIFGGIKRIAKVAELIVPIMALLYLVLALFVVFSNLEKLPDVLMLIFKSAFGLQEAAAGGLGYAIAQAMINGIKRGLFSNEAGMGSAPNAAASATPYHTSISRLRSDARRVHGYDCYLFCNSSDYPDVGRVCRSSNGSYWY